MDHALVVFPLPSDGANLDILCACPPNPLIELEMGLGVSTKSAMSWEMHAEQRLSMPMEHESVSKRTCSGRRAPIAMRARTWSARMACGHMCIQWAECFQAMAQWQFRTCCRCHVSFQESMSLLALLIQDFSTCPHCPISHLKGERCDFGM